MHVHSATACKEGEARYELLVHHVDDPQWAARSQVVTARLSRLALPQDLRRVHRVVDTPAEIDPEALWALAESEPANGQRMRNIVPAVTTLLRHCMLPVHEDGVRTCSSYEHEPGTPRTAHRSYEEIVDRTVWVPRGANVGHAVSRHLVSLDQYGIGYETEQGRPRTVVMSAPLTPAEQSDHIQGGKIRLAPVLPSTDTLTVAAAALHVVRHGATLERVYEVPDETRAAFVGQ